MNRRAAHRTANPTNPGLAQPRVRVTVLPEPGTPMRKIKANFFISLDGVVQSPDKPRSGRRTGRPTPTSRSAM
jgi:hypothetical protein